MVHNYEKVKTEVQLPKEGMGAKRWKPNKVRLRQEERGGARWTGGIEGSLVDPTVKVHHKSCVGSHSWKSVTLPTANAVVGAGE